MLVLHLIPLSVDKILSTFDICSKKEAPNIIFAYFGICVFRFAGQVWCNAFSAPSRGPRRRARQRHADLQPRLRPESPEGGLPAGVPADRPICNQRVLNLVDFPKDNRQSLATFAKYRQVF